MNKAMRSAVLTNKLNDMKNEDIIILIDSINDDLKEPVYREEILTARGKLETLKQALRIGSVSQQRELLLAYHKHLDSFNDPSIYNATENMIDDYLDNNCG